MKILHTISLFDRRSGGTTTSTYELVHALNRAGCSAELATLATAPGVDDVLGGNGESWIKEVPYDCLTPFDISYNFRSYLKSTDCDIYHTNGLWRDVIHYTCYYARRRHKPYVITTHGMFHPQALAYSAKQKKLLRMIFFDRDINRSACVHVSGEVEARHLRALGLCMPIAIIGNPIYKPPFIEEAMAEGMSMRKENPAIGYLGRLHPLKNIDRIIKAFAIAANSGHKLIIMGTGSAEYEKELKELAGKLKLNNIEFTGFVSGKEKYRRLASLRALVMASDCEGFGMTVGEALLCQTPVICTKTAPWEDLKIFKCGRWVDNDIDTLADNIYSFLRLPLWRIEEMGRNGRELIEHDYNSATIARRMCSLYRWVLDGGTKPSFVV